MVMINLKYRDLYLISAVLICLIGIGFVFAYNPNPANPTDPAVMGHTVDELEDFEEQVSRIALEVAVGKVVCNDTEIVAGTLFKDGSNREGPAARHSFNLTIPTDMWWDGNNMALDCKTDSSGYGCIIKVIFYKNPNYKIASVKYCYYYQNSGTNNWICTNSNIKGVNGNCANTYLVKYNRTEPVGLVDDSNKNTPTACKIMYEKGNNKWRVHDNSGNIGMRIFTCKRLAADDIDEDSDPAG